MERVVDPFVCCPYNKQHRVPKSRLQGHIVKCQEKYPPLAICPYNATHRFPKEEIKAHVAECPSKEPILVEDKAGKPSAIITTPQPIPTELYFNEDDSDYESWD